MRNNKVSEFSIADFPTINPNDFVVLLKLCAIHKKYIFVINQNIFHVGYQTYKVFYEDLLC